MITIFIWHSLPNHPVGHVAMCTNEHYISFAPNDDLGESPSFDILRRGGLGKLRKLEEQVNFQKYADSNLHVQAKNVLNHLSSKHHTSRQHHEEPGPPSIIYQFENLDDVRINYEFMELKDQIETGTLKWAAFGSSFLGFQDTSNCSQIILDLLYVGGLANLINTQISSWKGYFHQSIDNRACASLLALSLGRLMDNTGYGYNHGVEMANTLSMSTENTSRIKRCAYDCLCTCFSTCFSSLSSVCGQDYLVNNIMLLPDHLALLCQKANAFVVGQPH